MEWIVNRIILMKWGLAWSWVILLVILMFFVGCNSGSGHSGDTSSIDQITEEEAEAREILEETVDVFWSWRGYSDGGDVEGWCGPARDLAYYTLVYLGIEPEKIFILSTDRSFETYYTHQFLVVDMHDGNTYLVDTTYGQFFQNETTDITHPGSLDWIPDDPGYIGYITIDEYWSHEGHPYPQCIGAYMRADEWRSETADIILDNGYILLDDPSADDYAQGFTGGANDIYYTVSDMKINTSYLREKDELLDRFAEKSVEENFEPSADAQAQLELILN
jgi:hypothetical protein